MSSDEYLPKMASPKQMRVYWGFAAFILFIGACGVGYALNDMYKNPKLYKRKTMRGFIPLFVGDLVWLSVYLPYHVYNFFGSMRNPDFDIGENEKICRASAFGATLAVVFNLYGLIVLAFALHKTVHYAFVLKIDRLENLVSKGFLIKGYIFVVFYGLLLFSIDFENLASYRGLYCAWNVFNARNGIPVLLLVLTAMGMVCYYYGYTYIMVKQYKPPEGLNATTVGGDVEQEQGIREQTNKEMVMMVVNLSVRFLVTFIICWFPILIVIVWDMFEASTSIEFAMLAGLTIKLKIVFDVYLLVTLPAFRNSKYKSSSLPKRSDISRDLSGPVHSAGEFSGIQHFNVAYDRSVTFSDKGSSNPALNPRW
eukprot:CAMPEP_0184014278 /NCGR_PEP_ID=MMETSP0954-20121128/5536_1 /TAXON_ID=627963 /ORGANISM="Aplanochytrium sp, Strain PBS07" /LENGTH=366 /DNA_ID=CAMNT_0026294673 /DNA_START=231 /DNA_END=1328 /DNA_ORIENTATION=-